MLSVNKLFVQEVVPFTGKNKTLSFCAFCDKGYIKSYWMGRKLREHPIEFGTATFSESVHVSEVIEPAGNLIRELNYTGPCEIEFLRDPRDNHYKLIEINARTWLWVGLARSCGIDFAVMAFNYANNWEYKYPFKYDLNVKWSNHLTDFFYSAIAMTKGKLTLSDFIKSYKGKIVHAVFDIRDIKPAIMYLLLIFRFLKNR
jgi:predicted ATP-grasp superfamily ATP-dependent carboligase